MKASALRVKMERFCPSHSGTRPLMRPAIRLPAEWAEINRPLVVSDRLYAAFRSGMTLPIISDSVPLQKNAKKQVNSACLSCRSIFLMKENMVILLL